MTQDLETVMKQALDGKFYSFAYIAEGGLRIREKKVSKNYRPEYLRMTANEICSAGAKARAKQIREQNDKFWTPENEAELLRLRAQNISARTIGRMLGVSRLEVGKRLNKLGILNQWGVPYHGD